MNPQELNQLIARALKEDSVGNDITTKALIPAGHRISAQIIAKEEGIVCGVAIAQTIFKKLDSRVQTKILIRDGHPVRAGQCILTLKGKSRAILSAERTALNFLGYLSGISTLTNTFVKAVKPYSAKIMDTRKTTPGLRALEKMAVRLGGGHNHRFDLGEMVLIKDNHLVADKGLLSLPETVKLVKRRVRKLIEVEVDTLKQLKEVLPAKPDIILLDNMSIRQIKQAVQLRNKARSKCLLEASGGINLRNVRKIAQAGVERISIGALTHSAQGLDFSLEFAK